MSIFDQKVIKYEMKPLSSLEKVLAMLDGLKFLI